VPADRSAIVIAMHFAVQAIGRLAELNPLQSLDASHTILELEISIG